MNETVILSKRKRLRKQGQYIIGLPACQYGTFRFFWVSPWPSCPLRGVTGPGRSAPDVVRRAGGAASRRRAQRTIRRQNR